MEDQSEDLVEIRLFEHIKHEHPDLFEKLLAGEQIIDEKPKRVFQFQSDKEKFISFYTGEKHLSYQFLDYHSTIGIFPYPEEGFEQFVSIIRDIMSDAKVVVSWIHEDSEPFAELIPVGEEEAYDFLWENATKVYTSCWSGKYDLKEPEEQVNDPS